MNEKKVINDFLDLFEKDKKDAYLKVWEASEIDFEDFLEHPDDFRDPSSGIATGMIYYSDTKPLGKKILAYALKCAGTEHDLKASFFIEQGGEDIDYNKVSWFVYECLIIDLIQYIEYLQESEENEHNYHYYKTGRKTSAPTGLWRLRPQNFKNDKYKTKRSCEATNEQRFFQSIFYSE